MPNWGDFMSETDKSGTLNEFNLHNLDRRTYELVENIIEVLELQNSENQEYVKRKLDEILDDDQAAVVLQVICQRMGINVKQLIDKFATSIGHIPPHKLLIHLLFIENCYNSVVFVSKQLDLDPGMAAYLLDQLRHSFTVDDPIVWLKLLLAQTEKALVFRKAEKQKLMSGLAITVQEEDTAEARKLKERRLNPAPHFGD